ncbi:MAG: endonuclease/exonuclease/phosphatase family protein [Mycobacterium sp.]
MKVMTWNVQGRVGEWEARHAALRSEIERTAPDVLTLQESWVEPEGATQADRLSAELGLHTVTAADLAGFDRYPEATYWVVNAVLSRWPLTIERLCPLPDERGEPTWRHVLVTRVHRPAAAGGPFIAAGTHLEHGLENSARRSVQLAALVNHLADVLGDETQRRELLPAVLAGDLNCTPESDEYRCATGLAPGAVPGFTLVDAWAAAGNTDPGHTWSASNPLVPRRAIHPHRRLDYVMVSTPRRRGAGHVSRCTLAGTAAVEGVWASDHFAVVAEIEM